MDLWLDDEVETSSDPMDTVETVIGSDDRFQCERAEDGDVHFSFKCTSGETVGYFSYRHELPALLFTLGFELQAPASRRTEAVKLAGLINENLWLGHFDVWSRRRHDHFPSRHADDRPRRNLRRRSAGDAGRGARRRRALPAGVPFPHSRRHVGRRCGAGRIVRSLRRSVSGLDAPSIALVGAGAMGGALVRGWIEAVRKGGGLTLTVVEPNFDPELERELDAVGAVLNPPDAGPVDVLVLAVKPQTFAVRRREREALRRRRHARDVGDGRHHRWRRCRANSARSASCAACRTRRRGSGAASRRMSRRPHARRKIAS